jgi:hypothetical protein
MPRVSVVHEKCCRAFLSLRLIHVVDILRNDPASSVKLVYSRLHDPDHGGILVIAAAKNALNTTK